MPKVRTVRAFSAGGVVFRWKRGDSAGGYAEVVLVGRASENFWVLPKGTPAPNETTAEVALREVREETGVTARIVSELGSIHYWFVRKGVRYNKEVFYFLMEATGGDVSLHDHEYDDARWFSVDEASDRLTYENEADMLRRSVALVAAQPRGTSEGESGAEHGHG
jgi:8-oxo-dGTP pyrophosphatase MutT (NUDIX family)